MLLCNYTTDFNVTFSRVKPALAGIDLTNNTVIDEKIILEKVKGYGIDLSSYFEAGNKDAYCSIKGKKRKLIIQDKNIILELEYPQPFLNLDLELLSNLDLKVETIGEFLNDGVLSSYFNFWRN